MNIEMTAVDSCAVLMHPTRKKCGELPMPPNIVIEEKQCNRWWAGGVGAL